MGQSLPSLYLAIKAALRLLLSSRCFATVSSSSSSCCRIRRFFLASASSACSPTSPEPASMSGGEGVAAVSGVAKGTFPSGSLTSRFSFSAFSLEFSLLSLFSFGFLWLLSCAESREELLLLLLGLLGVRLRRRAEVSFFFDSFSLPPSGFSLTSTGGVSSVLKKDWALGAFGAWASSAGFLCKFSEVSAYQPRRSSRSEFGPLGMENLPAASWSHRFEKQRRRSQDCRTSPKNAQAPRSRSSMLSNIIPKRVLGSCPTSPIESRPACGPSPCDAIASTKHARASRALRRIALFSAGAAS
mmetsp:Transcript_39656/g.85741  ORF Transcript_39656/g.85741 Transcript_39656/m.85741 type:complete len:300 (+) Transcript_39656:80-979(+)